LTFQSATNPNAELSRRFRQQEDINPATNNRRNRSA
jgi:hypothetical protein